MAQPFIIEIENNQIIKKTPIPADTDIVIGRSDKQSGYVVKPDSKISRAHCVLRYVSKVGLFLLTDISTNGTFLAEDNSRIVKNIPFTLYPDTSFFLADPRMMLKVTVE